MKILKNVILSIVLFMLSGCACDRKFIHNRSRYDSNYNFQAFNSEKYLNESGGKHFKHDNSLNRSKSLKIETYIPFPGKGKGKGKNEKKNSLIAKEYLGESDGKYFDNDFRHRKYREIEIYIPFPKWHRKKRVFTEEYPDKEYLNEEYLGESDSGYFNYDTDFSQSHDRQPQAYQPTSSKHQKPHSYITTSSKHQKPQVHIPTPSTHPKPQTYIPTPSKHKKP